MNPMFVVSPLPSGVYASTDDFVCVLLKTLDLPPSDLAGSLIKAYFIHVNSLLPVLHGPSFYRAIEAGMMGTEKSFRHLGELSFVHSSCFFGPILTWRLTYIVLVYRHRYMHSFHGFRSRSSLPF